MSYTMKVTYTCDNCGATAETDKTISPEGWGGPHLFTNWVGGLNQNETNYCPRCVKAEADGRKRALAEAASAV